MQTDMSTMTPNAQSDSSNELSPNLLLDTATATTTLEVVSVDPKKRKIYILSELFLPRPMCLTAKITGMIFIGLDPTT